MAVYLRNGIGYQEICKSDANCASDYLFLKIRCGLESMLLGVIYRPNKNIDISPVMCILERISCNVPNIVVCGDINCNLLNTLSSVQLIDNFKSMDLTPVNVSTATHFPKNESPSLLDVFFVGDADKALFYSQLTAAGFSKHDLIYLTYDIQLDFVETVISYRDFKNIQFENLRRDVADICMYSSVQYNSSAPY